MTSALRRGWLHLASGAGLGRLFSFGSNLLLSRWLGPTDLGLFNLVTTTVQTGDTLVRCGADYALNFELGGDPQATQRQSGIQLAHSLAQICSAATLLLCLALGTWLWFGRALIPTSIAAPQRWIWSLMLLVMLACEGVSASAWELLLVSRQTALLALRQGLFFPLRLLMAAVGSLVLGVSGALGGWCLVALLQCFWLKQRLGTLWTPLRLWPPLQDGARQLLKRGLPFYGANLLASLIFYPLLLQVASGSGLAEVGYLRVGQILQQLFAFLPATLVPVLFLQLRGELDFQGQVKRLEIPLRLIWLVLLEVLLVYCLFDQWLLGFLFGAGFEAALLPTRLLLLTALLECLAQLIVQPLLAQGRTRLYGFWQNSSALLAALVGWLWIPNAGLAAYLLVRLLYVLLPLLGFSWPVLRYLQSPEKMLSLAFLSLATGFVLLAQVLSLLSLSWSMPLALFGSLLLLLLQWSDVRTLAQRLMPDHL